METTFVSLPLPVLAATGTRAVSPASRLRAVTPAVASLLAAPQLPTTRHDWAQKLIMAIGGYNPVLGIPSVKLGDFRGSPPRGRPV